MPGWDKKSYNDPAVHGLFQSSARHANQRAYRFENKQDRSRVVAKDNGWVRRRTYTDVHGKERTKEELLTTIGSLSTIVGHPTVVSIHSDSVQPRSSVSLYVQYSVPVMINTGETATIQLERAVGGNPRNFRLTASPDDVGVDGYSDNVIRFTGSFTGGEAGRYVSTTGNYDASEIVSIIGNVSANTSIPTAFAGEGTNIEHEVARIRIT